jgi:hypothetical protein
VPKARHWPFLIFWGGPFYSEQNPRHAVDSRMRGNMGTLKDYQRYAARCLQEARSAPDSQQRSFLVEMAQAWRKLAEHATNANVGQTSIPISEPDRGD